MFYGALQHLYNYNFYFQHLYNCENVFRHCKEDVTQQISERLEKLCAKFIAEYQAHFEKAIKESQDPAG